MSEELDAETLAFAHRMFDRARSGDHEGLAEALGAGLPVNLTNDKGDTLLTLAAYHDHPAVLRVLLDAGADTSRANDRGQTALGCAVFRQSSAAVELLLGAGADPSMGQPSALEVARFFELPAMLQVLEAEMARRSKSCPQ